MSIVTDVSWRVGGGSSVFLKLVFLFFVTPTHRRHTRMKLKSNIPICNAFPIPLCDSEGRGAIMRVQGKHHSFRLAFVTSIFYNHPKVLHIVIYLCNYVTEQVVYS